MTLVLIGEQTKTDSSLLKAIKSESVNCACFGETASGLSKQQAMEVENFTTSWGHNTSSGDLASNMPGTHFLMCASCDRLFKMFICLGWCCWVPLVEHVCLKVLTVRHVVKRWV